MSYKNKIFFVSGYHKFIYCHDEIVSDENKDEKKIELILGGLASFINDSRTTVIRQKITDVEFLKLKTIEINEVVLHKTPKKYKFIYKYFFKDNSFAYRVTEVEQHKNINPYDSYLNQATIIDDYLVKKNKDFIKK